MSDYCCAGMTMLSGVTRMIEADQCDERRVKQRYEAEITWRSGVM